MAWLGTWAKRVKLTIDSGDITANLTDFPVLVYISAVSGRNSEDITFVFDELTSDANRKKIAVTKSDGTTELYVEIEQWDDANEKAWLWIKVSGADSISSSSDTDLYLYYDSAQADNTTYVGDTNSAVAENVWDSNFFVVHHMRDGIDNANVYDSTSNDNDGVKTGANEPILTANGQISEAQDFDAINDHIVIASHASLNGSTITVEVWAKNTDSSIAWNRLISKKAAYASNDGWEITLVNGSDTHVYASGSSGANQQIACVTSWTDNTYHYIVITYEGATVSFYAEGAFKDSGGIIQIVSNAYPLVLGDDSNFDSDKWEGQIDEVRLSNGVRSAAWIKASYESGKDDLLDWGSEENIAGGFFLPVIGSEAIGSAVFGDLIVR